MTNSDTIEIRRRDMVDSCPMADEVNRLRGTNEYLLKELEKERTKVTELEDAIKCLKALNQELMAIRANLSKDLDECRAVLGEARAERDDAEEERDYWYDRCTIAKGRVQLLKELLKTVFGSSMNIADDIRSTLDDIS
jgi:chromosome segregation ATPase